MNDPQIPIPEKEATDPVVETLLKTNIRSIPDFPEPGILFRDITPVLSNPELCRQIRDALLRSVENLKVDVVMAIESRGFLFGLPLAMELGVPFVPVRKKGKLPYKTRSVRYALEYGSSEVEIHEDSLQSGQRVLIHDDLLATGGTAVAAANLAEALDAKIAGFSFLITLHALNGRRKLKKFSNRINTLINY